MSLLFLIASLGVVNGVLLSFYLIFKSKRKLVEQYFGGLLLALSIRIGKSVFFYFDRETDRLILQIGLSACVFIGPFFYLYLRTLFNPPKVKRTARLLLIILLLAIVIIGVIYPYRGYPGVWNQYIIHGIYGIWSMFLLLGLIESRKWFVGLFKGEIRSNDLYLLCIITGVLFITFLYQLALYSHGFTYIWGAVAFTVSFYFLMIRALIHSKRIIPGTMVSNVTDDDEQILNQLNRLMEQEKPFVAQGLKLKELAHLIGVSSHTLSRVLNKEYKHGFANYISQHRVNEAKLLIASRHELSLEGIGYEVGFRSKSAFFDAFKKHVNTTPANYKKSLSAPSET